MNILAMVGNPIEIAVIAVVVLILFGGARIAGFGKSIGEGIRGFKGGVKEAEEGAPKDPANPPDDPNRRNQ